jgi:Core-2/I-Branching enzyme
VTSEAVGEMETGYPEGNLFHKREIKNRVETHWGLHSLATAAKVMIKAALQDPHNKKFIQLSEACVPLYPAATIYQVLFREDRSRTDACNKIIVRAI